MRVRNERIEESRRALRLGDLGGIEKLLIVAAWRATKNVRNER